jgi:hypothetical protein
MLGHWSEANVFMTGMIAFRRARRCVELQSADRPVQREHGEGTAGRPGTGRAAMHVTSCWKYRHGDSNAGHRAAILPANPAFFSLDPGNPVLLGSGRIRLNPVGSGVNWGATGAHLEAASGGAGRWIPTPRAGYVQLVRVAQSDTLAVLSGTAAFMGMGHSQGGALLYSKEARGGDDGHRAGSPAAVRRRSAELRPEGP